MLNMLKFKGHKVFLKLSPFVQEIPLAIKYHPPAFFIQCDCSRFFILTSASFQGETVPQPNDFVELSGVIADVTGSTDVLGSEDDKTLAKAVAATTRAEVMLSCFCFVSLEWELL